MSHKNINEGAWNEINANQSMQIAQRGESFSDSDIISKVTLGWIDKELIGSSRGFWLIRLVNKWGDAVEWFWSRETDPDEEDYKNGIIDQGEAIAKELQVPFKTPYEKTYKPRVNIDNFQTRGKEHDWTAIIGMSVLFALIAYGTFWLIFRAPIEANGCIALLSC